MEQIKNLGSLDIVKKRLGIMIAAKLRKENKIREAVQIQDELSKKSGSWSGEDQIIKWRELR